MKEKFYITTPIYYPSGKWHLGTCYTTVVCDAIARFKRMCDIDVFYLTGTDEHGQKIEKIADEKGIKPKEFVDDQVKNLQDLWKLLGISYDKFIRTTDEYHEKAVQKIFQKLYDQGDIYKGEYEGWYCTPCESFWTESQLVDGKCPDCGREVELTKESSYFFRLSKYQDRLIKLIENNPDFLQPKSRQNEMLNNFLRKGLQDLAVSRTSFKWGIPVPFDKDHVIYVWIDALTNYITALGYMGDDTTLFDKYWPADIHMMGKEIVRFHSIIWPAILMALGLPVPKKVYGHGWMLLGSDKISKSKGNVVDPVILSNRYGVDAVRYYLLREIPFGSDGIYTNSNFLNRINADLCNSLGNLLSRSTAMVNQFCSGILPECGKLDAYGEELKSMVNGLLEKVTYDMDKLLVPEALQNIFNVINRANKYIDETSPWLLAKDPNKKDELNTVLYTLIDTLRVVGIVLLPFLPATAKKVLCDIGVTEPKLFEDKCEFGKSLNGTVIIKGEALFPRLKIDKELEFMSKISEGNEKKTEASNEATPKSDTTKEAKKENIAENAEDTENKPIISIDDFAKIELKVGKVLTCEKVQSSRKLLHLTVDTGDKIRSIASGVSKWYEPSELIGQEVIVVTNLATATLGGIKSEGMILFADDGENVIAVSPTKPLGAGSRVK